MQISIQSDIDNVKRLLDEKYRQQIPYAASQALNAVAKKSQAATIDKMRQVFDRPTPFTLNSLFIRYATKQNLSARVFVKDRELAKSKSFADTIGHEFAGGSRLRSRTELLFTYSGLISSNEYLVPASGAKLDQYGNLAKGQIQKILSQLRIGIDQSTHKTNSARSRAKRNKAQDYSRGYFWSYGGKLKRGVWQRFSLGHGKTVKPILLVSNKARYRQRIDIESITQKTIDQYWSGEFQRQLDRAIATAK